MTRYYSDSKVFNWLRDRVFKIHKPHALPWGGWAKWEKELKTKQPIGWFFTEILPDWLEKPAELIIDPLYNAKYYLRNRFVGRTHLLKTNLKPGQWHEFEERVLHGLFTELVDFVEIEQASHHVAWDREARKKFQLPWHQQYRFLRWKAWRCPEAGLAYLQWCMTLEEPVHQRENAQEVLTLYTWWTEVYCRRKDEWEETGLREFWSNMELKYGENWLGLGGRTKMTKQESQEYDRLSRAVSELEEARAQEEEDMMIRLIKIRRGLWT